MDSLEDNSRTVQPNEKPFSCNLCNKSYKRKHALVAHTVVHTNERPYSCDVCSKSFARRRYLALHNLTHTKEKSYHCDVCVTKTRLHKH